MSRLTNAAVASCLAFAIAACGGDSDSPAAPDNGGGNPTPVSSVSVTPGTASVVIGKTTQLSAVARDAAGTVLSGRTIVWTTSAAAVATVDANGVVTGVAAGTANISASSEGKSAQAAITVSLVPVASVTVTPNAPAVKVGATATLAATLKDEQGNVLTGRAVAWSSSAPAIATVDAVSGVVTGVAAGTATITATSEGKAGSTTATVSAAANAVDQILLTPALDTIEAFSSEMIGRILKDANGNVLTGRAIQWTSSNPAVAAIDPTTGMLTGVDRGTVTVTATSEGKSATVTRVVVIKYRSISAGTMHACDIASGGIVWCWGLNGAEGRLGSPQLGETSMSSVPTKLPGNLRFAQLSTYGRHTCGITLDGKAYCWGYNGWGALGSGSNVGQSPIPMPVAGNIAFRSISAGSDHTCGVSTTNQAYCWGNNDWRQLGNGGSAYSGTPSLVSGSLAFAKVTAGSGFTCGITTGGATYCWGANSIGQIGDGGKISYGNAFVATPQQVVGGKAFQSVTLGNQFACAVTTAGQGYCWGSNNSKLGNGPNGVDSSSPVQVAGGLLFQSISSGYGHSCGVTTSKQVYCWGLNGSGQLGSGVANGSTPVRAGTIEAIEVDASGIGTGSGAHSCAISSDRLTVWCWGRNDTGQLGNGSTSAGASANPNPSIVVNQKPL
ncbi:MAG TPA: Ig-like domain-containing protein [Gemmatimonadaceae bacterium]|nr:Ig-like domain-containing protein [Gemmatimonadaceae bacterium]